MKTTEERNAIVEQNYGLVGHCVNKLNFGKQDEDLFQIGCIGLIKAAESFDETKGAKFSTYASICIERDLMMYIFRKREKILKNEISGYTPIDDTGLYLFDTISDEEDFLEMIDTKLTAERIVNTLSDRDTAILNLLSDGKTQKEIAKTFNMCQTNVSRIIKATARRFKAVT